MIKKLLLDQFNKIFSAPNVENRVNDPVSYFTSEMVDWLALHLKFGSVYFEQLGGISRPHVDQLQI